MPTSFTQRLAFIVWMALSLFALWIHELRAEPTRVHIDAAGATERIRSTFNAPRLFYPSALLGRSVPLVKGAFSGTAGGQRKVHISVVSRVLTDLDNDGVSEIALLVEERRCRKRQCVRFRRIDVWTVRASGITLAASAPLNAWTGAEPHMITASNGNLTIYGSRPGADETQSDIEETWKYVTHALKPIGLKVGVPYSTEPGCHL